MKIESKPLNFNMIIIITTSTKNFNLSIIIEFIVFIYPLYCLSETRFP